MVLFNHFGKKTFSTIKGCFNINLKTLKIKKEI